MNRDFVFLSLPMLPKEIKDELLLICKNTNLSKERLHRISSYYTENMNIAAQEYYTEQVGKIPIDIIREMQSIYSGYFYGGVYAFLGKAENLLKDLNAVTPPHCDRIRQVGINYLLSTGGVNVVTSFYNEKRINYNLSTGESLDYNKVSLSSQFVFPQEKWYAFNTQKYHSVENIENERYGICLMINLNPTFKKFNKKYKQLIF
jgi:hypothetical protein